MDDDCRIKQRAVTTIKKQNNEKEYIWQRKAEAAE
jgi:hypothetical protein